MATLLIEPFGGFAGDMFLASLLALGDPRFQLTDLRELAEELVPGECVLELKCVQRGPFAGHNLRVRTDESAEAPHRHLSDLLGLMERSPRLAPIRARAGAVLRRLAVAEGKVHGISPDEVHFHEVGAVDTLVDVCGALLALQRLQVSRVVSSAPLTGEGQVKCAHGLIPVPVPAVVEIFRGLPLIIGGGDGERLTPTGAALLAEIVDEFQAPGEFRCARVGVGAGTRDPKHGPANVVRVQLSTEAPAASLQQTVWCLQVHLDDVTGEEAGWCLEGLRAKDALDVWCTPIQMKKGRPGIEVTALCRAEQRGALEAVIFERTPSLGLRWSSVLRTECARSIEQVIVAGREVQVKVRQRPDYPGSSPFGPRDLSPEYEDLKQLAQEQGWSLRQAEEKVVAQFLKDNLS